MKVLFIASDNNRSSGAFLSLTALNAQLNKNFNVETKIILPCKGTGADLLEENHIPYQIIPSYGWVVSLDDKRNLLFHTKYFVKQIINYFAIRKIARLIRNEKFDLIHINTIYSYVGAKAALKSNTPFVWHLREILEEGQGRKLINQKRSYSLMNKADCIIAISKSVYQKYCYPLDCRKMRIVYNGIDADIFYRPQKSIFNKEKIIVIFVGGFNKKKGAFTVCDALKRVLNSTGESIEIWFVGEAPKTFVDYVQNCGITENCVYWGYQKNVVHFFEKADIAISASKMEAFGRTTAEALLTGNLVITTNTAGSKELVVDQETGLSFTYGNADQLAEKILFAIENKDSMRQIARKGQSFIKENMTAFINAKKIHELYKKVLYKFKQIQ